MYNLTFDLPSSVESVTINNQVVSDQQYFAGETLEIQVNIKQGFVNPTLARNDTGQNLNQTGFVMPNSYFYTLVMPENDVNIQVNTQPTDQPEPEPEPYDPEYKLTIQLLVGTGQITIFSLPPKQFYKAGQTLFIQITLDAGFENLVLVRSDTGEEVPHNDFIPPSSYFYTFVMPSNDVVLTATAEGVYAPDEEYGLLYEYDWVTVANPPHTPQGRGRRLEILRKDYTGAAEERRIQNVIYVWGNTDDIFEPVIGSSLEIRVLASPIMNYFELLTGDNRDFKVKYYFEQELFWEGYISQDMLTVPEMPGHYIQTIYATDGMKQLDFTRLKQGRIFYEFNLVDRGKAINLLCTALNQTFETVRPVNVAAEIYETRMDRDLGLFEQWEWGENALFDNGERQFYEGSFWVTQFLPIKDVIKRLVNPFLCRVFLWKNEFYVIRTEDLKKDNIRFFKYTGRAIPDGVEILPNNQTDNCINRAERSVNLAYTEFTASLNLGVFDDQISSGSIQLNFGNDDWDQFLDLQNNINAWRLNKWDYVNAVPMNRNNPVRFGEIAAVERGRDPDNALIWTTTNSSGMADPNLSYIALTRDLNGKPLTISGESSTQISLSFDYATGRRNTDGSLTPAGQSVAFMLKVGNSYLTQTGPETFVFLPTPNAVIIPQPRIMLHNKVEINNVVIDTGGNMELRLYQLINEVQSLKDRYVVHYWNVGIVIEENESLILSEIASKGITTNNYSNVHPEYETYQGDAITSYSSSAIKVLPTKEVSRAWSRDGQEVAPLLDLIVQSLANIKGQPNFTISGVVHYKYFNPVFSLRYDGSNWVITRLEIDGHTEDCLVNLISLELPDTANSTVFNSTFDTTYE